MKILCYSLMAVVLAGCLTSDPLTVSTWNLEFVETAPAPSVQPVYGTCRLQQVTVNAPCDSVSMLIRRADGTLAFDRYNEYVASPSLLIRNLVWAAMNRSGKFKTVVNANSSVRNDCTAEAVVSKLDLDCRTPGERFAEAEVLLRIVRTGDVILTVGGKARADAKDGRYGVAFSKALSEALQQAVAEIR